MVNKCSQCGICCRLFLVNLTEKEYRSGQYKTQLEKHGFFDDFNKATMYGANILKHNKEGMCIYLKNSKCSIHKVRPQFCRQFFCTSKLKKFDTMIELVETTRVHLEK